MNSKKINFPIDSSLKLNYNEIDSTGGEHGKVKKNKGRVGIYNG